MSTRFRAAIEAGDPDALADALHPDVVFNSPVVFRPYEGREAVMTVLREVLHVFEDFRYTDELSGEGTHGLVFSARVGDKQIQGWDYLATDADGLVTEMTVMVRPLKATLALAEAMAARLTGAGSSPAAASPQG
jgi:hypothetical protein